MARLTVAMLATISALATLSACSKPAPATPKTTATPEVSASAQLGTAEAKTASECPVLNGIYVDLKKQDPAMLFMTENNGVTEYAFEGLIIKADGIEHVSGIKQIKAYVATCKAGELKIVMRESEKESTLSFAQKKNSDLILIQQIDSGKKDSPRPPEEIVRAVEFPSEMATFVHNAAECPVLDGKFKSLAGNDSLEIKSAKSSDSTTYSLNSSDEYVADGKLRENDKAVYLAACSKNRLLVKSTERRGMALLLVPGENSREMKATVFDGQKGAVITMAMVAEEKVVQTNPAPEAAPVAPEAPAAPEVAPTPVPEAPTVPAVPAPEAPSQGKDADERTPAPAPRMPADEADKF